jgi:hypothetical protein
LKKKYVTIPQAWQKIFPDLMASKAPIAIAMSKGVFKPEIVNPAPKQCLLSEADLVTVLVTVFILHRCFSVGMKFSQFSSFPMRSPRPPAWDAVRIRRQTDEGMSEEYLSESENIVLLFGWEGWFWFDCRGMSDERIEHGGLPNRRFKGYEDVKYSLGDDRIIQRYLEAQDFQVTCIIRPRPAYDGEEIRKITGTKSELVGYKDGKPYTMNNLYFFPEEPLKNNNSLRPIATGKGLMKRYNRPEFEGYHMGYTEISVPDVMKFIRKRLTDWV